MGKSHLLMFGLILTGGSLLAACSSDTTPSDGSAGSSSAGSGGEAGAVDTLPPPPLDPQTVVIPGAAPDTSTALLVGGTDYIAKSEIVSVTIGTGEVGKSETYDDGDTVAVSSAGIGFALERSSDKVNLLDAGAISTTFDLKDPGTDTAPVDSKAYVPLLGANFIAILDLTEGKVSRRLDLSEFLDASDADGSVEAVEGVYDPKANVAYFLLQRIDRTTYDSSAHLACSSLRGLIIGIDAATDKFVDLNGKDAGKGIELQLVNPRSLSLNADGDTAYLLADGCWDSTTTKKNGGVEVVDLTAATSTVAYSDETTNYLAKLILTGGSDALIQYSDEHFITSHTQRLDLSNGTLGDELDGVPDVVSFDGTDLLGVQVTGTVGAVVRYKLATGKTTVISETSWGGDYATASSTALVQ